MSRSGSTSVMRAAGPDGAPASFAVDYVIGGKRMQDNVTVFPDGRWQVLPVYFHVSKHAWVDYTEAKQGALTPEHPFYWTNVKRMANHECLDCHTTGLRVTFDDRGAGAWHTAFTDGSVACESCHGAGGKHAKSQDADDILQPVQAAKAGEAMCARCHGPRNPLFPLLDADHAFRAGDRYDELYDPVVVGASGDFFADGRPSTSSFEYQAVVQSACYRQGHATCLTCHTAPHDAHKPAELRADPDVSCKTCHAAETRAGAGHSHHQKARCVDCHMPPVVSGVLDKFADHAIDVPVPANTIRHQVPSACGVCHADKTPEALDAWLTAQWPEGARRQARRLRLADAFDEATARASAGPLAAVVADAQEAPTLRGAAAIVLARRFGAPALAAVRPLLAADDVLLRAKACEAFGLAHAGAEAVAPLLDDRSLRVRLAAALALYDMHDARGESALAALARDEPHLMVPHLELANVRGRHGDLAGARAELRQVVQLAPYHVDALVTLAAMAAQQGDLREARARVAQALALSPHDRRARGLADKLASDPRGQ